MFNGFLFSTEFARRCAASGINIGNAVETPDATDAWQMNVQILALCNEQRQNNGLEKLMTREDLWEQVDVYKRQLRCHRRCDGICDQTL